ncbi:MAG TPA: ornithine cyclodeaminase family protein [Steroidobacteraceae bacterium]|nr:ornithine cyclodeaminase family protein [Steroidobacteraceae bacterium]
MVRNLTEADIARVLSYEKLIPAMERALAAFSAGEVVQPVRTVLTIEEGASYLLVMSAAVRDAMGAKLVSLYPKNAGTGVPTHLASIVLFESAHGRPIACLDGGLITEMRTAAVSAAVTRRLVPLSARVLAVIGSGAQARAHLEALRHVYRFEEVRVFSPTAAHAQRFAAETGARALDAEAAVRGADVVVVATAAREPVLKGAWLKRGAHVNAVGAPRPSWRELDDEAMLGSTLIVDSREAALSESGDVMLSGAPIFAEAGELFANQRLPEPGATTVFKSLGLAVEDIATARLVYDAVSATH